MRPYKGADQNSNMSIFEKLTCAPKTLSFVKHTRHFIFGVKDTWVG